MTAWYVTALAELKWQPGHIIERLSDGGIDVAIPEDKRDRAVYHTILSDMHRLQATFLNLQNISDPDTAEGLREHFAREQGVLLGKLSEWRQRRPQLYEQASRDFEAQVRTE
jgi:hypothetical protein